MNNIMRTLDENWADLARACSQPEPTQWQADVQWAYDAQSDVLRYAVERFSDN